MHDEYKDMSIAQLASHMKSVKEDLEVSKAHTSGLQKEWDTLRKIVIPEKLDEMGLDSGVGTVSKRYDAYCTIVPGAQDSLQIWLQERGDGDIVKPTVNSSTLKAHMKELFSEGEEIPEAYVNFSPYTYVAITKG